MDNRTETQRTRNHAPNGDFVATPETAQRDAEAARLRGRGMGYQAIADQLGISVSTAHDAVQRALRAIRSDGVAEVRRLELERLDQMWRAALKVLETPHVVVSHGQIVRRQTGWERDDDGRIQSDDNGNPIPLMEDLADDAPVLNAVDRLLKIQARRAALLGLDTPVKADVTVHKVDPADTALAEIINEAKAKVAAEEAKLRGES